MSVDLLLTPEDVADIVAAFEGTAYERIEVRTSRFTLRVARSGEGWTQEWDWVAREAAPAQVAETVGATRVVPQTAVEEGFAGIRSPLPGTFYRAPQPGAPPFVEVGDKVEATTVVGIVETMKLMNSIHAGVSGTVTKIHAENARSIDTEMVLMQVRVDT